MKNTAVKAQSLSGVWQAVTPDDSVHSIRLPGSLDENNIGDPATVPGSDYRYQRKYALEGPVKINRLFTFTEELNKRYFVFAERSRALSFWIDTEEIPPLSDGTLIAPNLYEVTGKIDGTHRFSFVTDNTYPGFPAEEIRESNLAAEETATNWNGLLGELALIETEPVFLENIESYTTDETLEVRVTVNAAYAFDEDIRFFSAIFEWPAVLHVAGPSGQHVFTGSFPVSEKAERFTEGKGTLYPLRAVFGDCEYAFPVGLRTFEATPEGFLLNGTPFFLRGETSRALHPETAYPPMKKEEWAAIFREYAAFGVNFVRFESHSPAEAAFRAADEKGMFLLPELSRKGDSSVKLTKEAKAYYRRELLRILEVYGNHPSLFAVGLPFSGEDEPFFSELVKLGKDRRPDLFFVGPVDETLKKEDFELLSERPVFPEAKRPRVLVGPVLIGMLPDLQELDVFSGVLEPTALLEFQEKLRESGALATWEKQVEMSGETALIRYREFVRSAIGDPAISGLLLPGLQDVPGRQTFARGFLNSHLVAKPYPFAKPERFRAFFGPVSFRIVTERHTYFEREEANVSVRIAYFGEKPFKGPLTFSVTDGEKTVSGRKEDYELEPGDRKEALFLADLFREFGVRDGRCTELKLRVRYAETEVEEPFFLYPDIVPVCPESVYETSQIDLRAIDFLENGGTVFLTPVLPESEAPSSEVIDTSHPVFQRFVTGTYADERWEALSSRPGLPVPERVKPIVGALPVHQDGPVTAELFEAKVSDGAVFVSTLPLKANIRRPEAAALVSDIYDYLSSYDFHPTKTLTLRELQDLLQNAKKPGNGRLL